MVCSSENTEITASVTDVLGRVLVLKKFSVEKGVNHMEIDVSTLSSAIYFFKVATSNGLYKDCKQLIIDK
ncbi:MAG: T9SS type A sorting domain-containing protein [Bacteroidetes bacterium]|nr:T9SS type A sorting domain-containing protein [Bacteroidota bacterium]